MEANKYLLDPEDGKLTGQVWRISADHKFKVNAEGQFTRKDEGKISMN